MASDAVWPCVTVSVTYAISNSIGCSTTFARFYWFIANHVRIHGLTTVMPFVPLRHQLT